MGLATQRDLTGAAAPKDMGGILRTNGTGVSTGSAGGLTVSNSDYLQANGDGLIWGRSGSGTGSSTVAVGSGGVISTLDRSWSLSATQTTGAGGRVSMTVDLGALRESTADSLRLLWRPTADGQWQTLASARRW